MRLAHSARFFSSRIQATAHVWPLGCCFALFVALGCGEGQASNSGGAGGDTGVGGAGRESPGEIAALSIAGDSLVGTRIGQRWAVSVTALDAFDEPIPDVDVTWTSSDVSVADVSDDGLVTSLRPGVARIIATASGYSDSVELISHSAVPSDVGEMYTTWFPRFDEAPVAVVDGKLEVFTIDPGAAQATRPWPHAGVARF